ncbi:MAG: phosphoribosyltransferase domain-containing protein, partial [Pseudomonadota bacterium]|nr:phosphoribosyltransferase domain-containing protein [Pseudomonadota bacterium]
MQYRIAIRAGRLAIATRREDLPLEALLDFASRHNPKRGFLFVSRVLGKHIPCRPRRMREIYERLAQRLGDPAQPLLVVGMAETATGLGGGVADSLAGGNREVMYIHTTRHHLDLPRLLETDEAHSHAPEHILYRPRDELAGLFRAARTLVLVDDEISTGRTLARLAQRLARHLPRLQRIFL